MNYIEQIKGFWIAQEVNQLGTSEIALYFHLLEICNKTGWTGTFNRNNYKVMADLSIRSPKTLQSIKDKLQQAGIIVYKQRNGDANCAYSLTDLGKFYRGNGIGSGGGLVGGSGKGKVGGSGGDNINGNETKPNQTSKSHSAPQAAAEKIKKEDDFSKLPYWKKFIETWDQFYQQQKNERYIYQKKDFGCLKRIYEFLKKRSEVKGYDWTEENLVNGFTYFLKKAFEKDDWMKNNFSIPNILSQFNQIANAQSNSKKGATATGAGVSTSSILSKIDSMPD